jgi:hypothetical protein
VGSDSTSSNHPHAEVSLGDVVVYTALSREADSDAWAQARAFGRSLLLARRASTVHVLEHGAAHALQTEPLLGSLAFERALSSGELRGYVDAAAAYSYTPMACVLPESRTLFIGNYTAAEDHAMCARLRSGGRSRCVTACACACVCLPMREPLPVPLLVGCVHVELLC